MSDPPVAPGHTFRRWFLIASLLLLIGLLPIKWFVADFYTVPQEGMLPGIESGGRFLGRKHPYSDVSRVQRGDVIVFRKSVDGKSHNFVWRVIGLPGDRIETSGDAVRVNGSPLPREKLRSQGDLSIYRETNGDASYEIAVETPPKLPQAGDLAITVPPNEFFLLGDNRSLARDSRYAGTVRFDSIVAKKLGSP